MGNGCWDRFQTCLLYDACNCLFKGSCIDCFSVTLSILSEMNEDKMLNYCLCPLGYPEKSYANSKMSIILWLASLPDVESFISLGALYVFLSCLLQILSRQEGKQAFLSCLWTLRAFLCPKDTICSKVTFRLLRRKLLKKLYVFICIHISYIFIYLIISVSSIVF